MLAGRSVGAVAGAERDLAEAEMVAELGALGVGGFPVFLAGTLAAPLGDELPVMADHLFRVDRGLTYPWVVLRSRWPSSRAAMWMGRPLLTVSVEKTRRKSCGVNRSGVPSMSAMPAAAARVPSMPRTRPGVRTCGWRWLMLWNRCGSGGPPGRARVAWGGPRGTRPVPCLSPPADRASTGTPPRAVRGAA